MDVKTAVRTLDLFEAFAAEARPLRLSEVATLLKAPVSSCHQLLRTLEARGYLYGLQLKSYYPSKRMLRNAEAIARHDPLLNLLLPAMEKLRDATGESVLLAQLSGDKALLLEVVESKGSIRYSAQPGALRQLHCSAVGKCLLGNLSSEERVALLPRAPFPRMTPATLVTRRDLDANLEEGRERGWYASLGETTPELSAVAARLRVAGADFALSVAGPTSRFEPLIDKHARALMAAVRQVGEGAGVLA